VYFRLKTNITIKLIEVIYDCERNTSDDMNVMHEELAVSE